MLFHSPEFIFGFIPLSLLGFFLLARHSHALALGWLTTASLVFYAWWNPVWLPLLLASIGLNFCAGRAIASRVGVESGRTQRAAGRARASSRTLLIGSIAANIALLVGLVVTCLGCLALIRTQTTNGNLAFLRSKVPNNPGPF
ncbi:MAG: hypothetical protein B7Y51_09525 [Burkholderiales bacterium 28-67-8]|nr:MAG: hypothetical protein B7Y51_09525 [Burkholderiales bacterium 28-67-8]